MARRPGNAGVHTGTARREARDRTSLRDKRPGDGLERRPPAGRAGARNQRTLRHAKVRSPPSPNPEWRNTSPRRPTPGPRLFMTGGVCRRAQSWAFLPVGARDKRPGEPGWITGRAPTGRTGPRGLRDRLRLGERRPPAGIARERETSAVDAAPCQGAFPTLFCAVGRHELLRTDDVRGEGNYDVFGRGEFREGARFGSGCGEAEGAERPERRRTPIRNERSGASPSCPSLGAALRCCRNA